MRTSALFASIIIITGPGIAGAQIRSNQPPIGVGVGVGVGVGDVHGENCTLLVVVPFRFAMSLDLNSTRSVLKSG